MRMPFIPTTWHRCAIHIDMTKIMTPPHPMYTGTSEWTQSTEWQRKCWVQLQAKAKDHAPSWHSDGSVKAIRRQKQTRSAWSSIKARFPVNNNSCWHNYHFIISHNDVSLYFDYNFRTMPAYTAAEKTSQLAQQQTWEGKSSRNFWNQWTAKGEM